MEDSVLRDEDMAEEEEEEYDRVRGSGPVPAGRPASTSQVSNHKPMCGRKLGGAQGELMV